MIGWLHIDVILRKSREHEIASLIVTWNNNESLDLTSAIFNFKRNFTNDVLGSSLKKYPLRMICTYYIYLFDKYGIVILISIADGNYCLITVFLPMVMLI